MRAWFLIIGLIACASPVDPPIDPTDWPDTDVDTLPVPIGFGDVSGRVCAPSGKDWVAGAKVTVRGGGSALRATTDGQGWFVLRDVPAGQQILDIRSGSFTAEQVILVEPDVRNELEEPACLAGDGPKVLVFEGRFDPVGDLLDRLGVAYEVAPADQIRAILTEPGRLEPYDVMLVACGADLFWAREEHLPHVRSWVRGGGSLYASDHAWPIVAGTFPDSIRMIDSQPGRGQGGPLSAKVTDPWLVVLIDQHTVDLTLDRSFAILSSASAGETLLEAKISVRRDGQEDPPLPFTAPLAVRDEVGDGRLLYTSFHNDGLSEEDAQTLLKAMLLSL